MLCDVGSGNQGLPFPLAQAALNDLAQGPGYAMSTSFDISPGPVLCLSEIPQAMGCSLDLELALCLVPDFCSFIWSQEQLSSQSSNSAFSRSKRPVPISTAPPQIQSPMPVIPHQKVGAIFRLQAQFSCGSWSQAPDMPGPWVS